MKKVLVLTSIVSLFLLPVIALGVTDPFAQSSDPPPLPERVTTYGGVIGLMSTIGNWMFGILLALAVIFLVYAAFLFLTSQGDPGKTASARNIIIYAVVAIVVAILAKGIVLVAQTLVT